MSFCHLVAQNKPVYSSPTDFSISAFQNDEEVCHLQPQPSGNKSCRTTSLRPAFYTGRTVSNENMNKIQNKEKLYLGQAKCRYFCTNDPSGFFLEDPLQKENSRPRNDLKAQTLKIQLI